MITRSTYVVSVLVTGMQSPDLSTKMCDSHAISGVVLTFVSCSNEDKYKSLIISLVKQMEDEIT